MSLSQQGLPQAFIVLLNPLLVEQGEQLVFGRGAAGA